MLQLNICDPEQPMRPHAAILHFAQKTWNKNVFDSKNDISFENLKHILKWGF